MSSARSKGSHLKCYHCYAEKRPTTELKLCARCKLAWYCSKDCQVADWKNHKSMCNTHVSLQNALERKDREDPDTIPIPGGLTAVELDSKLEKWIRFHGDTLMTANLHALELPRDIMRTHSYVFHIVVQLRPEQEHGNKVAKFFRVTEAEALPTVVARARGDPWRQGLDELERMRADSERQNRGTIATTCVTCEPLAVQFIPYGSLKSNMHQLQVKKNWKERMMKDIEEGKKFSSWAR